MSPLRFRRRSDAALAQAIGRGELEALETLYRRHQPALRGFARARVRDHEAADDIVQQAFLNLALAIGEGTEVREPRGFLFRVVRNLCCDEGRRRQVDLFDEEALGPAPDSIVDTLTVSAWTEKLGGVLDELPARQRWAFVLAELRGLSYVEVADALDTNTDSVRQLLHRARVTIREQAPLAGLLPAGLDHAPAWPLDFLQRLFHGAGAKASVAADRLSATSRDPLTGFLTKAEPLVALASTAALCAAVSLPQLPALLGPGGADPKERVDVALHPGAGDPGAPGLRREPGSESQRATRGPAVRIGDDRAPVRSQRELGTTPASRVEVETGHPPRPPPRFPEVGLGGSGASPPPAGAREDPVEASGDTGRHGSPPRRDTGSGLGSAPGAARNTQAGGSASASTPEGQSTDAELEIDGEGAAAEQTGTFPLRAGPDGVKLGKAAPFAPAVGWKVNPSAEPDSITLEIEGIGNDRAHDVYWSPEAEFPQGWRAAGLRPGHFALPVPGPGNYWLFVIGYDRNGRSPDGREAREVSEVVMVRVRNVVEVADGDVTPRSPLVDPRG